MKNKSFKNRVNQILFSSETVVKSIERKKAIENRAEQTIFYISPISLGQIHCIGHLEPEQLISSA